MSTVSLSLFAMPSPLAPEMLLPGLPLANFFSALLGWLMAFLSVFLILLVLIQRGRGGGLTGALGGPGGQSAFGSKAGDTFTVITVVVAAVWGFTCAFAMWSLGTHTPRTVDRESQIAPGPRDTRDIDEEAPRTLPGDGIGGLLGPADDAGLTEPGPATDADDDGLDLVPADGGIVPADDASTNGQADPVTAAAGDDPASVDDPTDGDDPTDDDARSAPPQ